MKRPPPATWATEADMFGSFVAARRAAGFACYPESCGHDLILRAPDALPPDVRGFHSWGALQPGDVVAVEGKLRPTLEVLFQALPPGVRHRRRVDEWPSTKPPKRSANWYAVLVPAADLTFREVAHALGIAVTTWPRDRSRYDYGGAPFPPSLRIDPAAPLDLPPVQVDLVPGQPAPRSITGWKVRAVRACLAAVARGGVLSGADLGTLRRNFVDNGWAIRVGGTGKGATYQLADRPDRPDRAYPELAAALAVTLDPFDGGDLVGDLGAR